MPQVLDLLTFSSSTGDLSVFEGLLPGNIKRVYYISHVPIEAIRGGHRHHKTWQALICLRGSCKVFVDDNINQKNYLLDTPEKCLILEPKDWHRMDNFSEDALLLVLANEYYDQSDYIDKPYRKIKEFELEEKI
jgi:dTDP-4-dehydrorhamnose 3,5-epimerase-like enzyme